jgi:hypothetical protein
MTGPINARTDPDTGLRFYNWNGQEYPSVTSIRRLMGMPYEIHAWALNKVIDRAIVDHDLVGTMLKRPKRPRERVRDKNVITEVAKHLRSAATDERDQAGDVGNAVHDAIHAGISPDDPGLTDLNVRARLWQYRDFMQTKRPTILFGERQVWNLTYGYSGSPDALMLLPNGRIVVVDFKTGGGVYLDHVIQVVAYGMGEFVGENGVVDVRATDQLLHANGLAILHLANHYWEWIEVALDPDIFRAFIGSLSFARFLHSKGNRIDPLVTLREKGGTLVPVLQASIQAVHERHDIPTIPVAEENAQ